MNRGIVGLPNVGKSTIFPELSSAPAEAANYPFCTIDPDSDIEVINIELAMADLETEEKRIGKTE